MDALLYILTFALIAAPVYFIDKRFGAPVYRRGYNLWHKEPLLGGVERGFIVGRKSKERILPAFVLTIFSGFLLHYYIHDPIELVMKTPLIFVGFSVGFLLTGFAMREEKKPNAMVDRVCGVMDSLEEGKLDLSGVAGSAINRGALEARATLVKVAGEVAEKVGELRAAKPVAPPPDTDWDEGEVLDAPPTVAKTEPQRSFQDALDAFTKRK